MIKYFFVFLCLSLCKTIIAQKPSIEISDFNKWSYVSGPKISNDGNFAVYTIRNQPVGSGTLMIVSTNRRWEKAFIHCNSNTANFTRDSRKLIFQVGDSLCFFDLQNSMAEYIQPVSSYKLSGNLTIDWIAIKKKGMQNELHLKNLKTGDNAHFLDVNDFQYMDNGRKIVLSIRKPDKSQKLVVFDLHTSKTDTVYTGTEIQDLVIDSDFPQLVFTVKEKSDSISYLSLWFYNTNLLEVVPLISESIIEGELILRSIQRFSTDGNLVFLNLSKRENLIRNNDAVKVDVWNYLDPILQSVQIKKTYRNYSAVVNIRNKRITRIEKEHEQIQFEKPFKRFKEEYAVVIQREGNSTESNWNIKSKPVIYLVSLLNGERKNINIGKEIESPYSFILSPLEKFLIYYDPRDKNYYSLEIESGINRNITQSIKANWALKGDDPSYFTSPIGVVGFTENDDEAIIYDQNDIFQISLIKNRPPLNLTNGYGKGHEEIFRIAMDHSGSVFKNGESILLNAFSTKNKNNGFCKLTIGKQADPQYLTMQPYVFIGCESISVSMESPVKAKHSDSYIVRRMNAEESQNYFYTSDFKNFKQLSFNYPEQNYNWLTSQLFNYQSLDGKPCQGILYKPENFDSTKKYPIIFYYYEKLSDCLNAFLEPKISSGELNIPFYVSNGYLVFTPDIHYKIGYPGWSAYNSVVSVARDLSKYPWVDSKRMGLQGHSFGGYQTNYIVTRTNIFRAACSAAGVSDFISAYGNLIGDGTSRGSIYEKGQSRMGCSIWENKNLYIENSPIFQAEKVTTPILLNNNGQDLQVPFEQGLEFFLALRRLGKKVWMLQYEGEGHVLDDKAGSDFSVRMKQFFDHYLKGAPAPKWMTRGIPASMKSIDDGLELDIERKTPDPALLIRQKIK